MTEQKCTSVPTYIIYVFVCLPICLFVRFFSVLSVGALLGSSFMRSNATLFGPPYGRVVVVYAWHDIGCADQGRRNLLPREVGVPSHQTVSKSPKTSLSEGTRTPRTPRISAYGTPPADSNNAMVATPFETTRSSEDDQHGHDRNANTFVFLLP